VKFLGSCDGTDISVSVTEFPSVVVADAKQESGRGKTEEFSELLSKNGQFFENWKHDPRPMVTRFTGVNHHKGMTLRVLSVDFTDGDSVFFTEEPGAGSYWDESWSHPIDEKAGMKAVRYAHLIKTLSRSRATKNGSTGQIVDFLMSGTQHRTTSTSSGA
jgi:hypothetical protein